MQWFTTTTISDHQSLTPEGFLLVKDVRIARCGTQYYRDHELPDVVANHDGWISVDREPSEVFRADSISSFHGKPITNDHPMDIVTPDNYSELAIGHMQNVRRGTGDDGDCLVADLLFTTKRGIDLVRRGKRALSVGYDAHYEQTAPGLARQRNIVANHVAVVDEGRCGARCTIVDGAPAYWCDWEESEHPRGQPENKGEFAKTSGGSEGEGGRAHKGAVFVSPSVAEHLDFGAAIAGLQSNRQRMLAQAAEEIDRALGLQSHNTGAVGAWSDGAENSIMSEIDGGTIAELKVAAAMKAHIAEQKAALVFQDAKDGDAWLYSFKAEGDLAEIHANLLADGIAFHTVIPTKGGATVYVADTSGDAADAVKQGALRYHSPVIADQGHADFIGTTKEDGTDAEQRADAQQAYERIIAGSGVQGADALWQRIHDAYGATLHGVGDHWSADVDWDRTADIGWRDWEEAKHPRGQPENKGEFAKGAGGGGSSSGGGSASKGSSGTGGGAGRQTYVRAGETGEAAPGADPGGVQAEAAKAFATKMAGKVFSFAKEQLGAEDYEIVHEHFKNAKTRPKDRGKVSHGIRAMAKGLGHLAKAHVMEEAQHAKHAAGALKSLVMLKKPTPEQAKGLFSFGARALMVAGSMALGDPTGHAGAAIGNLVSTFGEDAVHHVMLEHAVKLFVGGSYGAVKGAVAKPQTDAAPGEDGQDKIPDKSGEGLSGGGDELADDEIELLQKFLECLADTVDEMTEEDAMRIILQGQTPDDEEDGGEGGAEAEGDGDATEQADKPDDDDATRNVDSAWDADIDWKESEHPREPEGAAASKGGEWTKGAGASAAHMAEIREKKGAAKEKTGANKEEKAAAQAAAKEQRAKERETARTQKAAEQTAAKAEAKAASVEAARVPLQPRSKAEPYGISTRLPSEPEQKRTSLNAHQTAQHLVDYESTKDPEAAEWRKKATDLLVGNTLYPPGRDKNGKVKKQKDYVGMPKGPADETPEQAAERFIAYAQNNILAIHDAVPESWRTRASQWYDGAQVIAKEWAEKYGVHPAQIAGTIAAQSPKKDWFQNVEVARRMLDYQFNKNDVAFNDAAAARFQEFIDERAEEKPRKVKPGEPQPETKKQRFERILAKLKKPDGSWMKLGELKDPYERAVWISMYDQGNKDNKDILPDGLHYKELSPEGKYGDFVRNKDQEEEEAEEASEGKRAKKAKPGKPGDPTVLVWPTMENIAKGLSILDNGSPENISQNLGDAHKVRNFYMNILYPKSEGGHVTIDTHAIAGAFMRPLGQNDDEVGVGLGNKSPSNNTLGLGGTYPFIAEAYRRAAIARGILPRQMQSIVWEGLRGLYSPEAKRDKKLRGDVDALWRKHMANPEGKETNLAATQAAIMKRASPGDKNTPAGVPRTPKWYARTADHFVIRLARPIRLRLAGLISPRRVQLPVRRNPATA